MLLARNLRFSWSVSGPAVLDDVSLAVAPGEVVGISGASGCGKSTLGRLLAGHLPPQGGHVLVGDAVPPPRGFHPVQYLAQAPELAVNPRWRIGRIVAEAGVPEESLRRALKVDRVWSGRFPHELSGGELQRVAILRALQPGLRYLVADEISAMLDAVTQAEIWRTLLHLARDRGIGILAISHDAALLGRIASRRLTLSGGRLRE